MDISYSEDMAEGGEGEGITRRGFLQKFGLGLAAALGIGYFAREARKPTGNQELAEQLWDEFLKDPEKFQKEYPALVRDNLVASPDGLNIRSDASAISPDNIIGRRKPGQFVGTAIQLPSQRPHDPDGPWYVQKEGERMIFFSGKYVEEKKPVWEKAAVVPTPTDPIPKDLLDKPTK